MNKLQEWQRKYELRNRIILTQAEASDILGISLSRYEKINQGLLKIDMELRKIMAEKLK